MHPLPALERDLIYSWEELGSLFAFKPAYLGAAGGMVPRPNHNALILITHPQGGRSFDYEDYWEGADLIYTGRGQNGDQELTGANGDVASNHRQLLVFENVGTRSLRFLGNATCAAHWPARGRDSHGNDRTIYRFRLRFDSHSSVTSEPRRPARIASSGRNQPPQRVPRPFDPFREIATFSARAGNITKEEVLAAQEKSSRGHQDILVALYHFLTKHRWDLIEEVPAAIDMRATYPGLGRVIFEAKTITEANEIGQCRAGLSQLLEYRFFYGDPEDKLCVVVDAPIADARLRFLESLDVAVVLATEGTLEGLGSLGIRLLQLAQSTTL